MKLKLLLQFNIHATYMRHMTVSRRHLWIGACLNCRRAIKSLHQAEPSSSFFYRRPRIALGSRFATQTGQRGPSSKHLMGIFKIDTGFGSPGMDMSGINLNTGDLFTTRFTPGPDLPPSSTFESWRRWLTEGDEKKGCPGPNSIAEKSHRK